MRSATAYLGAANQPTVVNVVVENNTIASAGASGYLYPVSVAPPTGTITVSGFPSGVPTSALLTAGVDPGTGAPDGTATFTIPAGTSGNYSVVVSYPGDANYNSTSAPEIIDVQAATGGKTSTTAATLSGNTLSPTAAIIVTGTVTGQGSTAPTGTVYAVASGYLVGQANLSPPASGDVASFAFPLQSQSLLQGANFITVSTPATRPTIPRRSR